MLFNEHHRASRRRAAAVVDRAGRAFAEPLEPRVLMAARIWDGGGGTTNTNWTNGANWQGDVAPAAGDSVTFPANVTQRTSVNDLAADTSIIGVVIDGTDAYTISGNRIALGAGGVTVLSSSVSTFNIPVALNNLGSSVTVSLQATLSMSGPVTGSGPLSKNGDGRLELTADSPTYTGAWNVNAGVLRINTPLALGDNTQQTFVVAFATLIVGIGASGIGEGIFIGGQGNNNQGALRAEGTSTWAGAVQLNFSNTVVAVDAGDFTISGAFSVSGGTTSFTKSGPGRLILSGSVGLPSATISAGVLNLQGTPMSVQNTTVSSGAAIELQGSRSVSATGTTLTLAGAGPSATGALLNVSGNNTWNGDVALGAATTIGSAAGSLTLPRNLNTGSASPGFALTIAGAGNVGIGAGGTGVVSGTGSITKTGAGTLTLIGSGASTYSGATSIAQGIVVAAKTSALGATGAAAGTSVSAGASLRLSGGLTMSAEPLSINGAGAASAGALGNVSGNNTWTGPITLGSPSSIGSAGGTLTILSNLDTTANAHTLTFVGAGAIDVPSTISGGGNVERRDSGLLILTGVNTYTGRTLVIGGTVRLLNSAALGSAAAASDTVVSAGGMVQLSAGSGAPASSLTIAERLTLSGTGIGGIGALHNLKGPNEWSGPVTIAAAVSIGADDTVSGPGVGLAISGVVSGAGALTKVGGAVIGLEANNAPYTGRITVAEGRLAVTNGGALGSAGAAANTVVQAGTILELVGWIPGSVGITTAEPISLAGRLETTGLEIFGNIIGSAGLTGTIGLVGSPTIATFVPTTIGGIISGAAGFTKVGSERLTLSAVSTYTGDTSVNFGLLLANGTIPGRVLVGEFGSGEIGGTGTIGPLTVVAGGIVDPGVGGPGRLTVNGDVLFGGGPILRVRLNGTAAGTQFDQLRVINGNVNLGSVASGRATLAPTLGTGFTSAVGDVFRIIDVQTAGRTITGVFTGMDLTVSGQRFTVSTTGGTGNDAAMTHVNTGAAFGGRTISSPINEGGLAVLSGTIVDPDPLDTFFLDVNWGDGSAAHTFTFQPGSSRSVTLSHRYRDNASGGGAYTVSLLWHDQNNGQNSDTLSVQVNNVAPLVLTGGDAHLAHNGAFNRIGLFLDPGQDSWNATVDYGDGGGEQTLGFGPLHLFGLHHRYTQDGLYHVTVRVADDDGGIGTRAFDVRVGSGGGGFVQSAARPSAAESPSPAVNLPAGHNADGIDTPWFGSQRRARARSPVVFNLLHR